MESILETVGWCDEVKVSQNTGFVVDGHMRASIAISRNETVPVTYLDLTPEEESLVLATFDPIGSLAVPDEGTLNSLIGDIATDNTDLALFLDGLYSETNQTALKDAQEENGVESESADPRERKAPSIRVLLPVPDIQLLEQALVRVAAKTRGEGLMVLCRSYLDGSKDRKP